MDNGEKYICVENYHSKINKISFLKGNIYTVVRNTGVELIYIKSEIQRYYFYNIAYVLKRCNLVLLADYREERINKILNG